MQCDQCKQTIPAGEAVSYQGRNLCEDCYLDLLATPKVCDPWAVHAAKKEMGNQPKLTAIQSEIMALLKRKGPLSKQQICEALNISEQVFRDNFATLRHMELARGFRKGDAVCYTLFES